MSGPLPATPEPPVRRIDSSALLDGASALEIVHRGERYLLRVTRQGKLILTK